ncbi:MAG: NAD(P)-dependent oxidoreductase, partial [Spirochaetales bacterium]
GGKIAGGKIAVIGAGPAGLSCACELRLSGYTVEIFEAETVPSGLTLFGIAPYKIRNQEVLDEVRYLEDQFGFTIHYSRLISREEELKKLEKEYDAIFLGIGLGNTIGTSLPGEDLPGCVGATEFIRDLKVTHQGVEIGKKVIVLGGGNTAMDAASEAARLGAAEIILAYRRSRQEKPAYDFEYMLARGAGVRGLFNVAPVAIRGSRAVEGVRFIRTKTAGGRIEVIEGSEFDVPCDMVIRATGQEKKTSLLKLIKGLSFDRKGCIVTDPATFQTGNRRFFAGGDAVNGGAEVVNAAAEGKAAARGIHAYISGKEA